ncbi:uncharacterized protein JCM10292_004766 [Rhodotorula paludigena]|uniref:uncharacterized protein n=1 Tax=Rhodotorula paludigena TaxID=86838 RepID=UPI003173BFB2
MAMARAPTIQDADDVADEEISKWTGEAVPESGQARSSREPEGHDHLGWRVVNNPRAAHGSRESSSANSLARISHYYAAKYYGVDGHRWAAQQARRF